MPNLTEEETKEQERQVQERMDDLSRSNEALAEKIGTVEDTLKAILGMIQQEKAAKISTNSKPTREKRGRPKGSKNKPQNAKTTKTTPAVKKSGKNGQNGQKQRKISKTATYDGNGVDADDRGGIIEGGRQASDVSGDVSEDMPKISTKIPKKIIQQTQGNFNNFNSSHHPLLPKQERPAITRSFTRYNRPNNFEKILGGRSKVDMMYEKDKRLDKLLSGNNIPTMRDRGLDFVEALCSKCGNLFDIPTRIANKDPETQVYYFTCDNCIGR